MFNIVIQIKNTLQTNICFGFYFILFKWKEIIRLDGREINSLKLGLHFLC